MNGSRLQQNPRTRDIARTHARAQLNKRKRFRGHKIAGYACVPTFSNDGRYVASGDGAGSVWFWEWKSGKVAKVLEAHDEVCIQTIWHPVETSNVVTCSWDGSIKYWG